MKEIGRDYDKLKQLILIEEFKNGSSEELKLYMDEKKVENAYKLATLADECTLTHGWTWINLNKIELLEQLRRDDSEFK